VKLLRAIQERRVRKVGATAEEPVDVRLISATHQNLADWVEQGKFRQDLYYRLNVIELRLPPLRERRDDVGLLAGVILQRLAGTDVVTVLSPQALVALQGCTFPGNVRELENILERAMAFAGDHLIEVADLALRQSLPLPLPAAGPPAEAASIVTPADEKRAAKLPDPLPESLPDHLDDVERDIIRRALARTHFNRTQAAELLGISFRQLRYRMQRLEIHGPE
jgi:two-component system response regulator PilR (NtrC family)